MKTVLDLVQEFASLDDTKTRSGGILPPPSERRWAEVKAFYDLVMVQSGLPERRGCRFTAIEIAQRVVPRARLRVRVEIDLAVLHQTEYHSARVMDLRTVAEIISHSWMDATCSSTSAGKRIF